MNPLPLKQIALLCAYAAGMAGGQMLFKLAALRIEPDLTLIQRLASLVQNRFFLAALLFYFGLSLFWVWLLSFIPISRAYPFLALAFAVTPVLGIVAFGEQSSVRLMVGLVIILVGLFFVTGA